jgi:tetratricopeptide (TPR) repeat protein
VPEALTTAQRAESLLTTVPADAALMTCVQERVEDLETVLKLDEALFVDYTDRAAEYERLFRACGIDLRGQPAEEAAAWIRGRFIAADLVGAIDLWVLISQWSFANDPFRCKLISVARLADPDPWRDRARQASQQGDTDSLEELTRTAPVGELPPATLRAIAATLANASHQPAWQLLRRDFMRRALLRFPSDVWLNHLLADSLCLNAPMNLDEATGFFRILVALRPNTPLAYVKLASVLAQAGKQEDAISYLRIAAELNPSFRRHLGAAHHDLAHKREDLGKPACCAARRKS